MSAFKWKIEIGSSEEESYRWREVQFGDGYKQVVPDGINYQQNLWKVLVVVPRSELLEFRQFVRQHSTGIPIDFIDPTDGVPFKAYCKKFKVVLETATWVRIQMDLERAYLYP